MPCLIILCVFLSLIVIIASVIGVLWLTGKSKLLKKDVDVKIPSNVQAEVDDENIITYNGERYKYNENVTSVLCMGIDRDVNSTGPTTVSGSSGQADALYLLVIDTKTGKLTAVAIPRDSIVEVDLYSNKGKYIGVDQTQICLSFAYGNGKKTSCENTVRSVSRLFLGMPVNSYFAVDYRSIPTLHNAVGNFSVIPNENLTLYADGGPYYLKKGKSFKLTGKTAFQYLQVRNQHKVNAAYLRMERQIDYLKKYGTTAYKKTKENISFPVKLFNKVSKNSITDLDASKITFLSSCAIKNSSNISIDFIKLKGEYKQGDNKFAELFLDENQIFDTVISLFYKKID